MEELTQHSTVSKYLSKFDKQEHQRVLKYLVLFSIQTLTANYSPSLTLTELEDLVYEQEGTKLFNPITLRDSVINCQQQVKENVVPPAQTETVKTITVEQKKPNKSVKLNKVVSKSIKTGSSKVYPDWWGHEEPQKAGFTQRELFENRSKALKEKDRTAYINSLRRQAYHPIQYNLPTKELKSKPFVIDSIPTYSSNPIYEESTDDVLAIASSFLKNKSFLSSLSVE